MKQVLLTRWALPFPVCLFMESFPCSRYSATHSDYRFKTIVYLYFFLLNVVPHSFFCAGLGRLGRVGEISFHREVWVRLLSRSGVSCGFVYPRLCWLTSMDMQARFVLCSQLQLAPAASEVYLKWIVIGRNVTLGPSADFDKQLLFLILVLPSWQSRSQLI